MRCRLASLLAAVVALAALRPSAAHGQQRAAATWSDRADGSVIGSVRDGETGEALPGANVFLDGTLRGTATDAAGRFHLKGVPEGTYKLVVSRVGYETLQTLITLPNASRRLFRFRPASVPVALPGVTVRSNRAQWEARYERFADAFLGNTKNAADVHIENPSVLSFEVSGDTLRAHANRPLQIANEALGYEIEYHLDDFGLHDGTFRRDGSGLFEKMTPGSVAERNRWWRARRRAYYGSLMHFTRVLARGHPRRAGFRLYRTGRASTLQAEDGALRLPAGLRERPVDDVRTLYTRRDSTNFWLRFGDAGYLMVVYEREPEEKQFMKDYYWPERESVPSGYEQGLGQQVSWIANPQASVLIDSRSGLTLTDAPPTLTGYWGWSERVAERLPRSYRPHDDIAIKAPPLSSFSNASPPPTPAAPPPAMAKDSAAKR